MLSCIWRQSQTLSLTQHLSPQWWGWAGDSFLEQSTAGGRLAFSPLVLWGQHLSGPSALPRPQWAGTEGTTPSLWLQDGNLSPALRPCSLLCRGTCKTVLQRDDACSRAATLGGGFCQRLAIWRPRRHLIHFHREASASDQAFSHCYSVPVLHADITCDTITSWKKGSKLLVTPNALGGLCVTAGVGILLPKCSTSCGFERSSRRSVMCQLNTSNGASQNQEPNRHILLQ